MAKYEEQIPLEWKAGGLSYSTGLTLAKAQKMILAGEAEARRLGLSMVIAIVDAGGHLLAFARMENAMLASIQIAMDKAFTAVTGKIPTHHWREFLRSGELPPLFVHERWTAFPGGFPIIEETRLLGGIGASGATSQGDTCVARAALSAGGFSLEAADTFLNKL